MEKLKEALIKCADLNPSLFRHDDYKSCPSLIEQRFSQFFFDFQTPSHPPYAAMIQKAIVDLNENRGSSEESISKYIKQEHADLPWAHSTLLKHHLEKLCDRKEISLTHKQRYLLPDAYSEPISISTSEKQLERKQNSETGKKRSRHYKMYKRKKKRVSDLEETNEQIVELFQEQDEVVPLLDEVADEQENVTHNGVNERECLNLEYHEYEEGNNLIDVRIEEMEEGAVCANDKEQIELQGKKKRKLKKKSKRRSKRGKKNQINEDTQLQDLSEPNLIQKNEVIECKVHEKNPQNKGTRVWTKSKIKKMANMPKDAECFSEETQQPNEAKSASSGVSTRMAVQRAKLRSIEKKKCVSNAKKQKKNKNYGGNKMTRRSSRKRKASRRLH